jgi:hypothetical protein
MKVRLAVAADFAGPIDGIIARDTFPGGPKDGNLSIRRLYGKPMSDSECVMLVSGSIFIDLQDFPSIPPNCELRGIPDKEGRVELYVKPGKRPEMFLPAICDGHRPESLWGKAVMRIREDCDGR